MVKDISRKGKQKENKKHNLTSTVWTEGGKINFAEEKEGHSKNKE